MTAADLRQVVADFAAASANARRAGFDGVELHALGSFLLPQFLNPALNRRGDGYGGDRAGRRRLVLEVVDAVAGEWDGARVGVRLSPWWTAPCFPGDEAALADHDELVAALREHPVAYLHLRGPEPAGGPDLAGFDRYRRLFGGPLVVNHGFDRESGNAAVAAGVADAVSFGTAFIANPDLVSRFAWGRPLNAGDPATYYTPGVAGYLDYPVADWAAVPA
jgi:N-ethylmaleimide reductase